MSNAAAPPQPPLRKPPTLSHKTVTRAAKALLKWHEQNLKPRDHDDFVYLTVTLKKAPHKGFTIPEKIALPHSLIDPVNDFPKLCLIIDDRAKNRVTKESAMKKIKSENIPINEVIKVSKVKSDFRSFEAKSKLCDSHDMFLADRRVISQLPGLLGKKFFGKKKIAVGIDLKQSNWKEQIEEVCGSALFFMGSGTFSVVKIGRISMESKEITENVMTAIDAVANIVPSKWKNIRSFHLKLVESLALPVYQSVPDAIGNEEGENEIETTEKKGKGSKMPDDEKAGEIVETGGGRRRRLK